MARPQLRTILIAEDDPLVRRVAEIALTREGYAVRTATDGAAALQLLAESPADLVILDGLMPCLDGFETCRLLKANPRTAGIPVIFLSARSQPGDEAAGRDAGAIGYIRKPFNALTLGRQVRAICEEILTA